MNQPIPRPRHRPYRPTWTATPGTIVTVGVELEPDERDGPTMAEIDEAAERTTTAGSATVRADEVMEDAS